jgi:uncharacterized membrane protein
MWTRELIKERAKKVLRTTYIKAFFVSLILSIATTRGRVNKDVRLMDYHYDYGNIYLNLLNKIMVIVVSIAILIILFRVFAGWTLEVGSRKYFIQSAQGDTNLGYVIFGFGNDNYLDIFITMFAKALYTFLWSLLFIIPGIIKGYAYRMVPYILADNPSIGHKRAIELSMEMTDGEKMNMFILDLSFLGWYLLGLLLLIVGVCFVNPYVNATYAELYLILREEALSRKIATYEELNLQNEEIVNDIMEF